VRELKSAFEYAFVVCHGSTIEPSHLPPNILGERKGQTRPEAFPDNKDQSKKRELLEALRKAEGNQSEAARLLGISRVTVWNRLKKFKIDLKREPRA
jgi:transcriptional regulator of acetoin/glycerol metabolism